MRVLVTGGAGFIGSHIVQALLDDGHEPVVLDTAPARVPAGVTAVSGDVRDADTVGRALHGVDAVCHQAAMVGLGKGFTDASAYVSSNDLGTAVLLERMAGAGTRALLLAGSMVVYGEGRYECPRHGVVRPGPRTPADL
ncbi:MAG TPA: NAD-dependent epimerase/dehydratase family protein, partial [Streptomyces sp.]|nr:NAD-dependent epimerase/dehydratase family protein [Streptomyces sp.]